MAEPSPAAGDATSTTSAEEDTPTPRPQKKTGIAYLSLPQHLALSPRQPPRRLTTATAPSEAGAAGLEGHFGQTLAVEAGGGGGGVKLRVRKTKSHVGDLASKGHHHFFQGHHPPVAASNSGGPTDAAAANGRSTYNGKKKSAVGMGLASMNQQLYNTVFGVVLGDDVDVATVMKQQV